MIPIHECKKISESTWLIVPGDMDFCPVCNEHLDNSRTAQTILKVTINRLERALAELKKDDDPSAA